MWQDKKLRYGWTSNEVETIDHFITFNNEQHYTTS